MLAISVSKSAIIANTLSRCVYESAPPVLVANALAVRTAFLICRPFTCRSESCFSSCSVRPCPNSGDDALAPSFLFSAASSSPVNVPRAFVRNAIQIERRASAVRSRYRNDTWIRDWKAASMALTRFVVRKRIPRKYLGNGFSQRRIITT